MGPFLGILVGVETGKPYGLINPDNDSELDDPQLLLVGTEIGEAVKLIRVPRGRNGAVMTPDDIYAVVTAYQERIR